MDYPSRGSFYTDLKNGTSIAKTDHEKLKQFAEQLKSVFATKIELKDNDFEREILNFLIHNIQDYSSLKTIDKKEEFISINEIDKIINNLDIKKVEMIESTTLFEQLNPGRIKLLLFFFKLCINFSIHYINWKIAKIVMLHKAGKPEDLVGS